MASINKLSVRGVRSFSPTAEEQVLEFFFPVTIIVGANGCGKTTIIESLKFAVCGALPPGKNSGQSFVHDPRSVGTQQVKAQVKLRFTNRAGCSMVAVRSMELEKKKTKLTFKQLDGVLRVVDKDGNKQSLSHKCSELDKQIPSLLGVSAAVLQHVVFCHQEDSSWPLQDAAVVKKNFDAIFDSSRYTKALEVFSKLKRDYTAKVKDIKAEVEGYKAHKHAAKGFRKDLEHYNSQLENLEEEMSARKAELKENEEELNKIYAILEEVDQVNNSIQVKNSELSMEETIIQSSKKRLREDLTETKSILELKEMLSEFEGEIELQRNKHREMKEEIQNLKKNLANVRQEREEMQTSIGRLQAASAAHQKTLNQRYDQLMSIASTYGLADVLTPTQTQTQLSQSQTQTSSYNASSLGDNSFSEHQSPQDRILDIPQSDIDEYYRVLSKKENEMRENLSQTKAKYQDEEDKLQSSLAEIEGKLHSIRNDEAKLEKQQKDARIELSDIAKELSGMSVSRMRKSDVDDAKRNAAEAAKKLESASRDPRRTEIPSQMRSLEAKVDSLKRDIEDDKQARDFLRSSEDTLNAIEVLKDQSKKELEELQESVDDVAFAFQQYNIDPPQTLPSGKDDTNGEDLTQLISKLVDDFAHKSDDLSNQQVKARDEVNRLQRLTSEAKALLDHNNGTVRKKREDMKKLEDKVANIRQVMEEVRDFETDTPNDVDESKPQELLSYLDSKLREEESSSTEGIPAATVKKIMKKLMKQAQDGNSYSCPCCKRSFDEDSDIRTFQQTLKALGSENSPLLKTDKRNKAATANYQRWKRIVSENANDVLEFRRLANESNDLDHSIDEIGQSLQDKQKQLEEAQSDNSDLEEKVEEIRNYFETSKRWAEAASRIAEKRMQVNQKKTDISMSQSYSDRDLKTVEKDLEEKSDLKDKYAEEISKLGKQLNSLNSQMSSVQLAASRTEKLAREKEQKFEKIQVLQTRKATLNEMMSKSQSSLEKMKEDIAPLRQKKRDKDNEKKRMRSLGKEEEDRLNSTLNEFLNAVHRLKETTRRIDEYKETNSEADLERFTTKSEELSDKINQYNSRIDSKQPALESLDKAIEDQENHKMNLNENIDLINSRQKLEVTRKELEKLEKSKMEIAGYDTCEGDMNRLTERKNDINSSISHLEGQRRGIVDNIRAQKRKLSQEEYKNVEEDYRVAMIKHETTQMAVRDLQRYHDALDKALLKYHGLKIAEINKIIRDLWTLTYKGEDITNIELVSGQETGSRASRSYNYRVVMTKGNTQLDMRGRCSAGQRVLASIVVRLALAETFCVNFGCIALDEPTVNLDYQNKRGLAIALAQITASRAAQRNFQLIMITHDEDFVAMMKTELSTLTGFSMPEKYFQVKREEDHTDGKFYSKIDAVDWDELL